METKPLLYGLIGFFIGGLIVSIAATVDTPVARHGSDTTMSQMTDSLKDLKGDKYDAAFIKSMTAHHVAAIEMAQLSEARANHKEIKNLSNEIMTTQSAEIKEMSLWQLDWASVHNEHSESHSAR